MDTETRYKRVLGQRQMDRDVKKMGGGVPKIMRRDVVAKAKKK